MDDSGPPPSQSLAGLALGTLRRRAAIGAARRSGLRAYAPALVLLAATPPLTALAAQIGAIVQDHRNTILTARAAPRIALGKRAEDVAAAKAVIAPLLRRPTVTDLAGRLAAALPDGAFVHAMSIDGNGAIRAEIDCIDPETLRTALRQDGLLGRLRMVGQGPAESGIRVVLAARAS